VTSPKRYPPGLRERAVRLAVENREPGALKRIAASWGELRDAAPVGPPGRVRRRDPLRPHDRAARRAQKAPQRERGAASRQRDPQRRAPISLRSSIRAGRDDRVHRRAPRSFGGRAHMPDLGGAFPPTTQPKDSRPLGARSTTRGSSPASVAFTRTITRSTVPAKSTKLSAATASRCDAAASSASCRPRASRVCAEGGASAPPCATPPRRGRRNSSTKTSRRFHPTGCGSRI
jgi:hypothetical protein